MSNQLSQVTWIFLLFCRNIISKYSSNYVDYQQNIKGFDVNVSWKINSLDLFFKGEINVQFYPVSGYDKTVGLYFCGFVIWLSVFVCTEWSKMPFSLKLTTHHHWMRNQSMWRSSLLEYFMLLEDFQHTNLKYSYVIWQHLLRF